METAPPLAASKPPGHSVARRRRDQRKRADARHVAWLAGLLQESASHHSGSQIATAARVCSGCAAHAQRIATLESKLQRYEEVVPHAVDALPSHSLLPQSPCSHVPHVEPSENLDRIHHLKDFSAQAEVGHSDRTGLVPADVLPPSDDLPRPVHHSDLSPGRHSTLVKDSLAEADALRPSPSPDADVSHPTEALPTPVLHHDLSPEVAVDTTCSVKDLVARFENHIPSASPARDLASPAGVGDASSQHVHDLPSSLSADQDLHVHELQSRLSSSLQFPDPVSHQSPRLPNALRPIEPTRPEEPIYPCSARTIESDSQPCAQFSSRFGQLSPQLLARILLIL